MHKLTIIVLALMPFANHAPSVLARTVLDLQKDKTISVVDLPSGPAGKSKVKVKLTSLNPKINAWFILEHPQLPEKIYHVELADPKNAKLSLSSTFPHGLVIEVNGKSMECDLWSNPKTSAFFVDSTKRKSFESFCNDALWLRSQTPGAETTKEWVASFLRSHVWGGEEITSLVKDYIFRDSHLINAGAEEKNVTAGPELTSSAKKRNNEPLPGLVEPDHLNKQLHNKELGLSLVDAKDGLLTPGAWYKSAVRDGVFVSSIQANFVEKKILDSYPERVNKLDPVENTALTYLVAFDMNKFQLGFGMGTDHPSAEWSDRTPEKLREKTPGPDGFDNFKPLVLTGKVNPRDANKTIATFTGGFKRSHGAFKWGRLSQVNKASHYGFLENGVLLSTLIPDLATIIINQDGSTEFKTWQNSDLANISHIKHARQNGVAIIEYDNEKKISLPGNLVNSWTNGNWSGSTDSRQRALRAATCIQESADHKFLVYAYFSSSTPNGMARVLQAYQCKYALHLDMNALEHTYLALYQKQGNQFKIEHVITGMNVLDRKSGGQTVPRFLGTADNREFFYVMEK